MRWSCPHCGVALAVADDKLGSQWTFSRCYKCGGFALVRKPEMSLVKVDQAPHGEKILLPEGSELPTMNKTATQHLASMINRGENPKPMIVPSQRRSKSTRAVATPAVTAPPSPPIETQGIASKALPPPLREDAAPTRTNFVPKLLPFAVAVASAASLASGAYLFKQGQNLFNPRSTPPVVRTAPAIQNDQAVATHSAPVRASVTAPTPQKSTEPLPGLVVRPKNSKVMLRTGPGNEFQELGLANPQLNYVVTEWKDRWFKVLIQDSKQVAWVSNDSVTLTPIESE